MGCSEADRVSFAAVGVAAAVAVAAVAMNRPDSSRNLRVGLTPHGTEYPLTELVEPTGGQHRVTQVPGHPPLVVGPTLHYLGGSTADLLVDGAPE